MEGKATTDGVDPSEVGKDVTSAPSPESSDVSAQPSGAGDTVVKDQPESVLDAAMAALAATRGAEGPTTSEGEKGDDAGKPAEAEDPAAAEAAEEKANQGLPFKDHPTWKASVTERRSLRQKVKTLESENADLKGRLTPEVERAVQTAQSLRGFMHQHALDDSEVNTGLAIMGLMKTDPERAFQALEPYYQSLLQVTGRLMPDDIRAKVDQGLLDQESAAELARTRSRAAWSTHQATTQAQRVAEVERRGQQQALVAQIDRAVGSLEGVWRSQDPDYPRKQQLVTEQIELRMLKNGAPRSVEEALQIAKDAKDAVDARFKSFVQAPRPIAGPTRGAASGSTASSPPKTALEAAQNALRSMRG